MQVDSKNIDFRFFNNKTLLPEKRTVKKKGPSGKATLKEDDAEKDINIRLLDEARTYWDAMLDFRTRRVRNRKYERGDQWHETMTNPDDATETITEEEYITNQGKVPLKQNMIRQVVKNILGQYRMNPTKTLVVSYEREDQVSGEVLTNAIRNVHEINHTSELDSRTMEEFLLSGLPINKITYSYIKERDKEDIMIRTPNPNRIFFNTDIEDIRMNELRMIGELLDVTFDELCSVFAHNEKDVQLLKNWYYNQNPEDSPFYAGDGFTPNRLDSIDFYLTTEGNKCRIVELWYLKADWRVYAHDYLDGTYKIVDYTLDEIKQVNQERMEVGELNGIPQDQVPLIEAENKYEQFWCVKYLTPYGNTLAQMETPYLHQEHPYSLAPYPLLDGEVWGFVEDIIDQQRYINRLITLLDFIMGYSAKGVLFIYEDMIPDGMNENDIADEWTKFNGVVKLKRPKQGQADYPKQIYANSVNIGAQELLSLQMKLLQDISGVHAAIQGQTPKSGTPSSLYAQEAQNATINLKDFFEHYNYFKKRRDTKVLKVLRQYWKGKRRLTTSGTASNIDASMYDADSIKNMEVEVVVTQGQDTPVYRQIIDDILFRLMEAQQIDIAMFLENSSLPFADKLLEQIKQRQQQQQQVAEQGGGQGLPPEMLEEAANVQQQASSDMDPQARELVEKLLQGVGQQG